MEVAPEVRLKRFLHFTSEKNVHNPGSRFSKNFYVPENVPSLAELIAAEKSDFIFDLIEKVIKEQSTPYPEAALFVLAECAKNKELKPRALDMAQKLCTNSTFFIFFIKFALEKSPSIGTGRQFRRFVEKWYLEKDAIDLAALIAETPRFKGWRHCDILKLSHLSTKNKVQAAVIKYAARGIEALKKEYGNVEETQEVIDFLENVEKCRKEEDAKAVARYIETYMLEVEHCNHQALKKQQVWTALLHQIPVKTLLDHFHLLCKYKLFRDLRSWDKNFVDAVSEAFTKPGAKRDGVEPNRVFIELINYENAGRIKCELSAKMLKKPRRIPQINSVLSKALEDLIYITLQGKKSTGKHLCILVDISAEMTRRRSRGARWVTLTQAAAFLSMYFLRTEPNTTRLLTFSHEKGTFLPPRNINRTSSVRNIIKAFEGPRTLQSTTTVGMKNMLTPEYLHTAISGARKVGPIDVCIVLTHFIDCRTFANTSYDPKKKMKFAFINLGGNPTETSRLVLPDSPNILIVSGFDEHTAKLLTEFATDSF